MGLSLGDRPRPGLFTAVAGALELSLVPLAWCVESLWGGPPAEIEWTLEGSALGAVAAVPPLAVLVWILSPRWRRAGFIRRIRRFIRESLGPTIASLGAVHIAILAASAGLGEELLFRGVLQPRMGLVAASIVFGLLHPFTPAYAVIAGLLGAYMGWLADRTGMLLVPVVAHAVYDAVALMILRKELRGDDGKVE